ncbi:MAG: biotin synthase BioB [Deltaproteobacteria bacterium]|nr:biotin synthase BioB [Deltaproteobacteria bacterium]
MRGIGKREAVELLELEGPAVLELLARANRVRHERRGDVVALCSIVNARSGNCGEDCAFCAQSGRARTRIDRYPLLPAERIVAAARVAARHGAACFSIVTSGRRPGRRELAGVARAVERIAHELPVRPSASLGLLDVADLRALRDAGLRCYHHNLETAESHFARICSTRRWSDGLRPIEAARRVGLSTCCGGILGLGESRAQRVELLAALRDLGVDSVPLNFLHAIPGTRLEREPPLPPLEALKAVAVARLMLPDRELRVCGGRGHVLRDLQSWIFAAGADGVMVGGYLTTAGRPVAVDLRMIRDAGLRPPARARGR